MKDDDAATARAADADAGGAIAAEAGSEEAIEGAGGEMVEALLGGDAADAAEGGGWPRSWGKFPPQGGVDPSGLIQADGGGYEHRVARQAAWEDAEDGQGGKGDEVGPRPEEVAAQSVEECVAVYEKTTLSVKNKHWVPSRSSDLLHVRLHAEWDAVDSAIRDVQV